MLTLLRRLFRFLFRRRRKEPASDIAAPPIPGPGQFLFFRAMRTGPNSPKKQPCPECGKSCKRTFSRFAQGPYPAVAGYKHAVCKITGGAVMWDIKLKG